MFWPTLPFLILVLFTFGTSMIGPYSYLNVCLFLMGLLYLFIAMLIQYADNVVKLRERPKLKIARVWEEPVK